jgi:protein O-mannosyl-transferase
MAFTFRALRLDLCIQQLRRRKMKLPVLPPCVRQYGPAILILLSMLIACGAFLQALNFPFVSDDSFYISGNTKLAGLRFTELWRLLVEPYNPYEFLPLRDFSYWIDISLFGMTPAAFRLHNLLLYVASCLLVYATTLSLWRYFKPDAADSAPWAAATVAALFALHPAHVEAVVWISGRKDLLSSMFALLAIWFAVKARREQGLAPGYAVAALLALLAAMLGKATSLAAAPVIALLWIVFWRDIPFSFRRRSMLLWPFAVLLLAACVAPIFMGYSTVKLPAYFGVETFTRALAILGWMVRLAISPFGRHYLYPVF